MRATPRTPIWRQLLHRLVVAVVAPALTLVCFLLLPLIESIGGAAPPDTLIRSADTTVLPPPPPPPEPEPEEEKKPEPEQPKLAEEAPPPDLSQLELALNPGFGDGLGGDFAIKLDGMKESAGGDADALFSEADLDQKPRVVYQAGPVVAAELRKKAPGSVHVLFVVDQGGRVADPIVQKSTDPAFERSALAAVKQWRFEPGKRGGKPVRFRMRVTITFPKN